MPVDGKAKYIILRRGRDGNGMNEVMELPHGGIYALESREN